MADRTPRPRASAKPTPKAIQADSAAQKATARAAKNGANGHHHAPRLEDVVKAFEAALGLFNRGEFGPAGAAFRKIVDLYASQTEIVARCNTYLAICSRRTQPAASAPRTADSLYDRGIVEINCGRFDSAIALFEKALKSHPQRIGHVLYALAAAQIRSGRVEEGLRNLERAVESHDVCRSKVRQDPDFAAVAGHDRFLEIVGDPYEMW